MFVQHLLRARRHAKCFRCSGLIQASPFFFHFPNELAEVQESEATCSGPHSREAPRQMCRAVVRERFFLNRMHALEVQMS